MTSIIGVHGIGNHLAGHAPTAAAQHLAATWRGALRKGPAGGEIEGVPLTVAYYAHRLRPFGGQSGDGDLDRLTPEAQAMIGRWLGHFAEERGRPQGRLTANLRLEIADLARRLNRSTQIVEMFAAKCFGEVSRYLHGDGLARHLARTEVANAIAAAASPRIVIAHSLGSVVTYEALHVYPHLTVDLLITLGSPLACEPVLDALDPAPEQGRGRCPRAAQRWINIADKGDLIAVPPGGVRDRFDGLTADLPTSVDWLDFHTVANYLRTPEFARALLTGMS